MILKSSMNIKKSLGIKTSQKFQQKKKKKSLKFEGNRFYENNEVAYITSIHFYWSCSKICKWTPEPKWFIWCELQSLRTTTSM